jgi:thiosulfate/3-mercaptopyruvate sulfurtransferase
MNREEPAGASALVEPEWLERHLNDPGLRIVAVDVSPAAYGEGHIPGAILWNVYKDLKDADYRLVDQAAIERLFERSGITPESDLVFYGYAPAMGFWLVRLFGHRRAHILNAGRAGWQREGRPWTAEVTKVECSRYPLSAEHAGIRARQREVEQAIGQSERVILDVRSQEEYRGERFWPSGGMEPGGRAGHVPGAAHLPMDGLQDEDGRFLPLAELRRHFADMDLDQGREIIPYCTIGGRACTTWFVLTELLGQERVRVYDGSWAEWGRMSSSPVESS